MFGLRKTGAWGDEGWQRLDSRALARSTRPAAAPFSSRHRPFQPSPRKCPAAVAGARNVEEITRNGGDAPRGGKKDEIAGIVLAIDVKAGTLKMKFASDGSRGDWTYKTVLPSSAKVAEVR